MIAKSIRRKEILSGKQRERQLRFLNDPNFPVSMVCYQLNLMQLFCVGSIDQCRTFGVCDLGEMLKMYEIFGSQFRVFGFLVHLD
jgi:hypothetical protein